MNAARSFLTLSALCASTASAATYTVKSGDTLYQIAQANGTDAATLARINGLRSSTIQVGQQLNLPGGTSGFARAAAPAARVPSRAAPVAAPAPSRGAAYVRTAASRYLGIRYVFGGNGYGGIDCSAFTMRVFQQLGIYLPRTAAAQWYRGYAVSSRNLQPGDLVFFNTVGRGVSHVGIYLGGGMMANANSYYGRTVVEPMFGNPYWASRYMGARRVMG